MVAFDFPAAANAAAELRFLVGTHPAAGIKPLAALVTFELRLREPAKFCMLHFAKAKLPHFERRPPFALVFRIAKDFPAQSLVRDSREPPLGLAQRLATPPSASRRCGQAAKRISLGIAQSLPFFGPLSRRVGGIFRSIRLRLFAAKIEDVESARVTRDWPGSSSLRLGG